MKYYLTINQMFAKEHELSTSEAFLFAWLYELPSWAERLEYGGKTYYFGGRCKACEELPIVSERPDTVYRLYKSLQKKELIEVVTLDKKDYIALTDEGKKWYYSKLPELGKISDTRKNFRENSEKFPTDNIYNNKEISTKVDKKKEVDLSFVLPELKEVFADWLEYKKDRKESYKSEKSIKICYNKLVKLSGNNPNIARQIVEQSMANNWAGLFALKNNGNGINSTNYSKKQDANNYALQQYLEEGERIARGERVYTSDSEDNPF